MYLDIGEGMPVPRMYRITGIGQGYGPRKVSLLHACWPLMYLTPGEGACRPGLAQRQGGFPEKPGDRRPKDQKDKSPVLRWPASRQPDTVSEGPDLTG